MRNINILFGLLILLIVSCNKGIEESKPLSQIHELKSVVDSLGGYYTDSVFIDNEGMIYNYYFDGIRGKTIDFQNLKADFNEFIVVTPEFDNNNIIKGIAINEFSTVENSFEIAE